MRKDVRPAETAACLGESPCVSYYDDRQTSVRNRHAVPGPIDQRVPISTKISMDVPETLEVSRWLRSFEEGDHSAARKLWECYFQQICDVAGNKTRAMPKGSVDAEDIAASVFESLWRGAINGRLEDVANRNELWWLLLKLTHQKSIDHIRRAKAQRRGGNRKKLSLNHGDENQFSNSLASNQITPEAEISFREEFQRLLDLLDDDLLRQIAIMKLHGYSGDEICQAVGIAIATLTRKVRLIKEIWSQELE